MALFVQGCLSAVALGVYRMCAARDAEDPGPLLAERGLAGVSGAVAPATAETVIRALVGEAHRHLSSLPGPGVAEVRAGIAAARDEEIVTVPRRSHQVPDAHLAPALAALAATHPALATAIAAATPQLIKVGPVPSLALFGRTRDVEALAEVIPAGDWPALEALRLAAA